MFFLIIFFLEKKYFMHFERYFAFQIAFNYIILQKSGEKYSPKHRYILALQLEKKHFCDVAHIFGL